MADNGDIQLFDLNSAVPQRRNSGFLTPYLSAEPDEGEDLRAYWQILKKSRWTILSIVAAVFTVGLIATLKEKPVYRASVLLEIEKENQNILTMQELFHLETVSDNYLETQYKILRSENLARRVITELRFERIPEFNPNYRSSIAAPGNSTVDTSHTSPGELEHEQAFLQAFKNRLIVEPVRRSRLVQVSFESQDPKLAAKAVNSLAENFIQANLENRWDATQKASEWLTQQLRSLKTRLEKSEDELQQYAVSNGLLYLETDKGSTENIVNERLRQLQDELTKAQADRFQKESMYRLVEAGNYSALPAIVDNKLMEDLTLRQADLERQEAELTSTFSAGYPNVAKIHNQVVRIQQLLSQERERAAQRITDDYHATVRREALVRNAFEEQQKQANLVAERSVQYNILKREVDTNKQLYEGLLQRLKEAGVSAGLKASNIRIVDPAVPPAAPVRPNVFVNLSIALLLGLCCAVGVAFLQEQFDNTLKSPDDIERFLRAPALAMIPSQESLSRRKNGRKPLPPANRALIMDEKGKLAPLHKIAGPQWVRIDVTGSQHSALDEAFRGLRTSVLLSRAKQAPRSLLFLSAEPGEGKTTIASNLAISLTQLGKRVLLIDGDMRRPAIHKLFEITQGPLGLASYLAGQDEWQSLVLPTGVDKLDCLVTGPLPPNPAELLSSGAMRTLILEAIEIYDFVLVDSPPLLSIADGRILASMVEGCILVVKGEATPRQLVQRANGHLREVGAHLLGVVLNNVDFQSAGYYGYAHGYGKYGDYVGVEDAAVRN